MPKLRGMSITLCRYIILKGTPAACVVPMILIKHVLLLVEWLRMIRGVKPVWGIYENVKNIVGKKFRDTTFRLFEEELHEYGYHTYWSVLNAKYYGIPRTGKGYI